eukprot:1465748-Amphidinium_carterae.1
MMDGNPPPKDSSTVDFTTSLYAKLPGLVTTVVKSESDAESVNKVVSSRDALLIDWTSVQSKNKHGSVTLDDIK